MYIDGNLTFVFILYLVIGSVFGFCLVFMLAGIRLSLNNRSRTKASKASDIPDKIRCRIEWREEEIKNQDTVFNSFIRANLEYLVNRSDYQEASKHALYMKDSELVRHKKEEENG